MRGFVRLSDRNWHEHVEIPKGRVMREIIIRRLSKERSGEDNLLSGLCLRTLGFHEE